MDYSPRRPLFREPGKTDPELSMVEQLGFKFDWSALIFVRVKQLKGSSHGKGYVLV